MTDSPENYHTFLSSHKIFETPFKYGYGFLVELECGHILEFADTTEKEKQLKKIFCPQCKAFREVVRYRRVRIGKEKIEQ